MSDRKSKIEIAGYKGKKLHPVLKLLLVLALAGTAFFSILLGLVLGGAHDSIDGSPRVMIILGCQLHDWGPSVMLQDRLDKALEYLEDHPDMTVVVAGGQGPEEPTSEAQGMADYLADHGVNRDNIILETQSHNTNQNLRFSAQRLAEAGLDPTDDVVIVSNGFHLTRAKMLAERIGFQGVSVLAAPSSHTPTRLKMYVREPLALVKSFVFDR